MSQGEPDLTGTTSGTTDTSGLDVNSMFGNLPNDSFDATGGGDVSNLSGGGSFNSFNDVVNALSGGGGGVSGPTSLGALSASQPGTAASATGGDQTGSTGGTQSATSPGATPANPQQSGGGTQQSGGDQQHAPPDAVAQLAKLLKGLQGKPLGPTGQVQANSPAPFALPRMAAGQTGPQSPDPRFAGQDPAAGALNAVAGSQPAAASLETGSSPPLPGLARGQTGAQSPQGSPPNEGGIANPPPLAAGETGPPSATEPKTDADGNPLTVAGTPAADTPTPPPRPGDATAPSTTGGKPTPKTDDQGREIVVKKKSQPQTATSDLPTKVPLPTKKPGAAPSPAPPAPPSRLIQDISGISTGQPSALPELAKMAMALAPLIGMFMGGGRGRRVGGFHGGRFTHGIPGGFSGFRGGMNAMRHPANGPWPYHHPVHGWDMHHMHPGGGWRSLDPMHAQQLGLLGGGGGQNGQTPDQQDPNAPDPNRPPKEGGADPGVAGDTTSGAIPGVSSKQVDDYTREMANKYGVNPDIASKVLAQESSYGQARRPGDNGTSFGPFQLHFAKDGKAMGDDFVRDTGKDPRDPSTWKDQIDYAMLRASHDGWTPWTTTMKKLGMNQWSGITTNRKFAGQPMSTTQPQHLSPAASIPTSLPITSQPMVAGP